MAKTEAAIFKAGSTTYFWSSVFFPPAIRDDVFRLYSFVRVVDDYVDNKPADKAAFIAMRKAWNAAKADKTFNLKVTSRDATEDRVLKNMVYLTRKHKFDPAWVEAFMDSMQSDLAAKPHKTLDDTLTYIYGSAEVIGLMMARIMHLPKKASHAARLQGRAMQLINFIRDIDEDNGLGRQYIPTEDIALFGLPDLTLATAKKYPNEFNECIRYQLDRYETWQAQARTGFSEIPRLLRIPVATAADMYDYTARQIRERPIIIFEKKVKPSPLRVVSRVLYRSIRG